MPKPNEVMRKAQGAPIASVMPTTQVDVIPTKWKIISAFPSNQKMSSHYDFYAVTVFGKSYDCTTLQYREVEVQRIYRALHPTCAVGRAILEFLDDYHPANASNVEVLKGII